MAPIALLSWPPAICCWKFGHRTRRITCWGPCAEEAALAGMRSLAISQDRGREDRLGSRSPLPPNRTGGSPASGSPVSGFTSRRIDEPRPGRRQGSFSETAGAKGPDLHRKAINMRHQHCGQSGPSHMCLVQSVVLSRCRHSRYGSDLVACHVTSTFLRSFAQRTLPRVFARMNALTPGRPALRILIRDNEHRPCIRPGLPASRRRTFRPFRLQPPVAAPGSGLVFPQGLPRGPQTTSLSEPWRHLDFAFP